MIVGTKTEEMRSARRWTGALVAWASVIIGGYFAGKRFTRHERGIQSAGALFNDAIGCNLVSGANLEEVSDAKFSCGDGAELAIRTTSFNEDCILRAEFKKRTQGITGVVARPCLHQAAG